MRKSSRVRNTMWRCVVALAVIAIAPAGWAQTATVAVVTTSPAGDSAAEYLTRQIDYPVTRRNSRNARDAEALMAEARASWRENLVVVIDAEHAVIRVLRPRDGTSASRTLDRGTASAPYAVSLAAAELLELVDNAPPPAKPTPRELPEPKREPPPTSRSNVAPWVGALFAQNGDVGLLQPIVGADLQLKRGASSVWYSLGLNFAGLVGATRRQSILLPDGSEEQGSVDYRRDQAALRAGIGHRQASGCALGFVDVTGARITVTARDAQETELSRSARWALLLAVGGELRYGLGGGFFVGIGAGLAWLPSATRFYASPENSPSRVAVFREGVFEFRAQPISVVWESEP